MFVHIILYLLLSLLEQLVLFTLLGHPLSECAVFRIVLRHTSVSVLGLVVDKLLKLGSPLGAVADAPLKANPVQGVLASLGERRGLALDVLVVLLALTGDPVSEPWDFALTRDKDMAVVLLVLLQL